MSKNKRHVVTAVVITLLTVLVYVAQHNESAVMLYLKQMQHLSTPDLLVCFSLIYIVANLFFVPIGAPLNLFAGMLWGTVWGGVFINLLAVTVATIAFFIARLLNQYWLGEFFEKIAIIEKGKQFINRHDWQFIFAVRVNPIIPFSLSNYVFGLVSGLSFERYISATMLANALPCFALASVGSILKSFSLHDASVKSLLFKITMTLLLVSIVLLLKDVWSKKQIYSSDAASETRN